MPSDVRSDLPGHFEVLVVGAGVAGLTAARTLADGGRDVLVVDKGWNPGGRMATRVTDEARFDHGATFFSGEDGNFRIALDRWRREGAVAAWPEGEERWRGAPDMRSLGRYLARGLRIATRTRLTGVGLEGGRWTAQVEDGGTVTADAVLMTPPVPQTMDLLTAGEFRFEPGLAAELEHVAYDRCFVVMAELDGASRVPAPGSFEPREGPIIRVVDERVKGTSDVPAVTLHASPEFSRSRWEADRNRVASEIIRSAAPWLADAITAHQIHGWRYCRPVSTWPEPCLVVGTDPLLILAGDAFGGPDVPGAHRSGLAAAAILDSSPR